MQGSFFGLNVAVRGLYVSQRNLDVANHNINNVNTPGYSRQESVQQASEPVALFDGSGMIGTGSEVVAINRVREEFMDYKYWSENYQLGAWEARKELLSDFEVLFNEPSDSGFNEIMNEFYSAFQELSKEPESMVVRSLIRQKAITFTKYFNNMATQFEKMQSDINFRVNMKVEEVNSLGEQIQQINRQIYIQELDGNVANDLRDKRGALVDKLSKIVNVQAQEVVTGTLPDGREDKHFVITISGRTFIDHFRQIKLTTTQRDASTKLNEEDIENLFEVEWEDGISLDIRGGELRGYLDMRDGNDGLNGSPEYKGIPYYIRKLNEFVRTYAQTFNEGLGTAQGHASGYRLDSVVGDLPSDVRFFTMIGDDGEPIDSTEFLALPGVTIPDKYDNLTAKNFTVGQDIRDDLNNISASDQPEQIANAEIINDILSMRHDDSMFTEGRPEDFMKSLISVLGIDSQQAVKMSASQDVIVDQIENKRTSISGVSLDEEMANMVRYQHTYNASARMIATMQEIYDTLVNKLGVGY